MRVFHLGNIGNVASRLAAEQRRRGHAAFVAMPRRWNPRNYPCDCEYPGDGYVWFNIEMWRHRRWFIDADVVHIHGGILWSQLILRWLRRRTPKAAWVLHYHGNELRLGYGRHHASLADVTLVSTPDLLRWRPQATFLPNPIDRAALLAEMGKGRREGPSDGRLRVGHFPTSRALKGTAIIQEIVATLPNVEFVLCERRPREEQLQLMASCDLVIDQVTPFGAYGLVAIEAMALGKPVVGSYDRASYPPGCPIVSVTPGTLLGELERLIGEGPAAFERLRRLGEQYVARFHSPTRIGDELERAYARALELRAQRRSA